MAHAFERDPQREGMIVGRMEPVEIQLVHEALVNTRALLGEPSSAGEGDLFAALSASMAEREAPQDPALRRLLPDGGGGDEEASREFRRLTEDTIRGQKRHNLDVAASVFARYADVDREQELQLSRDEARSVMMALTDVRLVLAERLDIATDEDAEALHELVESMDVPRSERDVTAMYYDFVTWLSESLTVAYMSRH